MDSHGLCQRFRGVVAVLLLVVLSAGLATPPQCRVSEFFCDTGQCVALDRYCDGADDCGDKSDEPRYCSPCNRTYFGDVGRTYELEIRRPREDRLPFLCHLNFTAGGGDLGDIVQLTFDTFTVGKFVSFTTDGCPDGHMSIQEKGRPSTGGQWCGSAWGYTVYYSETNSLNLTLQLYRLSEQGIGYNFDFKLAYKFVRATEARVRYGNASGSATTAAWRGDLVPGSYCDRVLERCDARACRVQSPNYPGVYPRNVTCYYRVEQRHAPRGQHAMLAVRQRHSHKVHIKDQVAEYDRTQRVLRVWDQCNVVQDYLTIYDGASTTDPVLVRLCGGDAVPDIVSSGPSMLLEFHTSPFDNPFHPVPLSYLPGFELEVQVLHVDARSHSFVRDHNHCEFLLTSFDASWGELHSPQHSLPPNTTCRYHFQGRRHETVWLAFLKYHHADWGDASTAAAATAVGGGGGGGGVGLGGGGAASGAAGGGAGGGHCMRLWDGRLGPTSANDSGLLLGEFCKDDAPRLCDHSLLSNATRHTRPCALPQESYASSGAELTLETFQASALFPVSFALRYEFVDTTLEGAPGGGTGGCDRVFRSSTTKASGRFQSPRSVFFYGRGGSRNLTCVLRFEAAPGERVRLSFTRARFGDRPCATRKDLRTHRWSCDRPRTAAAPVAEIRVSEFPWPGVKLQRDCLCSHIGSAATSPVVVDTLTAPSVEVNLTVVLMNITQDFRDFYFEGEYEFVGVDGGGSDGVCPPAPATPVSSSPASAETRRLRGSSGEISLRGPKPPVPPQPQVLNNDVQGDDATPQCVHLPWLIEPEDAANNFLYLKVPGFEMAHAKRPCRTRNRILVHSGAGGRQPKVICPLEAADTNDLLPGGGNVVEVFSDGWDHEGVVAGAGGAATLASALQSVHARSLVVEFLEGEAATYIVTWMEVSRRPLLSASSYFVMSSASSPECMYRCPELNACISAALWCDGFKHCPSGFDEDAANCAYQLAVPALYVAIGGAAMGVLVLLVCLTVSLKVVHRRRVEREKLAVASGGGGSSGGGGGNMVDDVAAVPPPAHRHHHQHHRHHNGDSKQFPGEALFLDGKDSLC